ncbi:nucleoside hydrolase [Aureobasidium pullulans]|uniref:Nucleoside hydrolase n=1 Tax=Aureobasidium pullulans TaxID=5580 RepID=A0A4S9I3U7_AURPU|nr:nucleoside hydrolase [Aureobasidium pullulans]THX81628.1 nucleoside hydrolase [Aureobasidium pullulans]THY81902.1 nucleoside hydrolase [Aureobasidium pullulans]THZ85056.1 nucleoside hydrolase [Aureobasidium pullulans]TIA21554.1 nucleoside hydrolase [Aureobasidium pullulans]
MSPSFSKLFVATSLVAASFAGAAPLNQLEERSTKNHTTVKPKVIMDNDWGTAGFIPYLMALDAGWDVLGLVSDTANSWALQCGLHALATLEIGNLSCIPVHKGADYPLLNTPELFQTWEMVHGKLAWEGSFAPENLTYEALGNDPTSGDPTRVSKAALYEGYPNTTFASKDAAWFMIQQVRKYPGQVSIYSAGALTNIALAIRMDPDFAKNAKELVIMGGYIDDNLLQVTGSVMQADWSSDVSFTVDSNSDGY